MQTVQFSSLRAMTPRARGAGSSFSCGYCTVTAGFSIVFSVTPRPPIRPGSFGFLRCHQNATLNTPVRRMLSEADRDQQLPRERLELVLTQARVREPHPEHQEGDEHQLGEQHERPEDVRPVAVDARDRPAAEEERRGERRERERGPELADEEEEEPEPGVLDHVPGDELALRDGHVERRLRELGLGGDEEQGEADELREDVRAARAR